MENMLACLSGQICSPLGSALIDLSYVCFIASCLNPTEKEKLRRYHCLERRNQIGPMEIARSGFYMNFIL
jgi:hypothetical protein